MNAHSRYFPLLASLLIVLVTALPGLRGSDCDKPECGGTVNPSAEEVSMDFPTEEAAGVEAMLHFNATITDVSIGGVSYWRVTWIESLPAEVPCDESTNNDQPPADSPKNDVGAMDLTEPEDDEESESCTSCGNGSGSSSTKQNSASPTAMNIDMGLGRTEDGRPLGRLRFGFDMLGGANSLRKALSLEYKPEEGKFVLDQFQQDAQATTFTTYHSSGYPKEMNNANAVVKFYWTPYGGTGAVTDVSIYFAPQTGYHRDAQNGTPAVDFPSVAGTSRDFQPVTISLQYSMNGPYGNEPTLTITETRTGTRTMKISGTVISPTVYRWTTEKFDGSTVEAQSGPVTGDELAAMRAALNDPTMEMRKATAELKPADLTAPHVFTQSYYKTNTGDPAHPSLLRQRTVTTGEVERKTIWTYHEGATVSVEKKNRVAGIIYDDGTWVAYPEYHPVSLKPTVELRPWMDGPSDPTAALANPNACRKVATGWIVKNLTTIDPAFHGKKLPKMHHQSITESAGGQILSTRELRTDVGTADSLGGPFAAGGDLASLGSKMLIFKRELLKDGTGNIVRTLVKVMTEEEAWGKEDDSAFSGSFDSATGLFTLRKALTTGAEGSYEEQAWSAWSGIILVDGVEVATCTLSERRNVATRYLAASGSGNQGTVQKVLYSGAADSTGTVVDSTSTESGSGITTVTRNGGVVSTESSTSEWINSKSTIKTTTTAADGSTQIVWTDAGSGEIVQEQDAQGAIKAVTRSGLTTTTLVTFTNVSGTIKGRESETHDEMDRILSSTDRNGRTTGWAYSDGGRTTTMTLPGGATRITSYYKDGQLKSITGSAVVPEFHIYAVNDGTQNTPAGSRPAGTVTEEIRLGSATSARVRWITRDALGRTISEQAPAPPQVSGPAGIITTLYGYGDAVEDSSLTSKAIAGSGATRVMGHTINGESDPHPDFTTDELLVGNTSYARRETTQSQVHVKAPGSSTALLWWDQASTVERGMGTAGDLSRQTVLLRRLGAAGMNSSMVRIEANGSVTMRDVVHNNIEGGSKNRVETVKAGRDGMNVNLGTVSTAIYTNGRLSSFTANGNTTTYQYDGLGHWRGMKDSASASNNAILRSIRTFSGGSVGTLTSDEVSSETNRGVNTSYSYDAAGHVIQVSSAAGIVCYAYDTAGRLTHQWGATYPVAYTYSTVDGQLTSMKTYPDGTSGAAFLDTSTATPPAAFNTAPAAVTTWVYDEASGALVSKLDNGNRSVSYLYDAQGRLAQRIWARGATTTYTYDAAGRLTGQTYSDNTPAVSINYNAAGQVLGVTDGSGARVTGFGSGTLASYPSTEGFTAQDADFALTLERPPGLLTNTGTTSSPVWKRTQSFTISRQPAGPFGLEIIASMSHTFSVDGKLDTVLNDGVRFTYGNYLGSTARSIAVHTMNGTTATAVPYSTMTRTIPTSAGITQGRVTAIKYGASGTAPESGANLRYYSGWNYAFDTAGRRTQITTAATGADVRPGWTYQYNARSEVSRADRYDGTTTQNLEAFAFDAIGNRISSQPMAGSPVTTYQTATADPTAYSVIQRPSEALVSGHVSGTQASGTTPTVTLADASSDDGLAVDITPTADRTTLADAGSYRRRFQVANASASRGFFAQQTVTAVDSSNATNTMKTWVYVPPVNEALFHDADGNLRRDARWEYHWDAENRLAVMEERPGIPAYPASATDKPARQRLEFFYDAKHRRSAKRVFHWDTATGTWTTWAYTLYLYDGWNLVAELDLLNGGTPQRTYTWGTDLSGTMNGAGGVGGLLMVKRWQRSATADTSIRALVHSDANGNVMGLYSIEAAKMLGSFDYDAFGNKVVNTVAMGNEVCPIGFSSKYEDAETGLVYYGYRYYSPELGRWCSRDPVGKDGGENLFGFCYNNPMKWIDPLGQTPESFDCCTKEVIAEGKKKLLSRYNTGKAALENAGVPHGGSDDASCFNTNYDIITKYLADPSIPRCWECQMENRKIGRVPMAIMVVTFEIDHWVVVCRAKDGNPKPNQSEELMFDYWANRPAGEDPDDWFRKKYREPKPGGDDVAVPHEQCDPDKPFILK